LTSAAEKGHPVADQYMDLDQIRIPEISRE